MMLQSYNITKGEELFHLLMIVTKKKINDYLNFNQLPLDTPYMVTADNKIYVSSKRKPCEQLFQRLMITYDGRVGMCCHDWGAQHCIGYVDNEGFKDEKEIDKIEEAIISRKKGFELLKNATRPKSLNNPEKKVESIESIWHGKELNKIRNLHSEFLRLPHALCRLSLMFSSMST